MSLVNNLRNSHVSFNLNLAILRRRRNQRQIQRIRHRIMNILHRRRRRCAMNRILQLPLQNTSDPFANQLFNGSPFF